MKKRAVLLILLSFIFPQAVLAVGISPPDMQANMVYGSFQQFEFYAINTMDYPLNIEIGAGSAYLGEYITLDKELLTVDPNEWKPFKVRVDYPDEPLKPGIHEIKVSATEQRAEEGMIVARASVTARLYIREAYPGSYAEAEVKAENKNIEETVPIEVILNNYGTDIINTATGYIDIFFNEEKIKTLELSPVGNITTYQSKKMHAKLDTKGLMPGVYTINAVVSYDEKTAKAQGEFKLGTLNIDITDFTKQAYQNKINPFEIIIESRWNKKINNVFADVNVKENNSIATSFRTISQDLEKWEQKSILGYLNAEGLSLGMHDIEIYLNYEGLQTIEEGKINITEEIIPEIEEPKSSKLAIYLTVIVAVLIAIIIFLIISMGRKKNEEETANTY